MSKTSEAPGPSWADLPKLLSGMLDDELIAFESLVLQYGDLLRFPFKPGSPAFVVSRPEWVQHVLQTHHKNYRKADTYEVLRPLLGDGLLLSDGDFWLRQRRLVAPMFHRKSIAKFVDTMTQYTAEMLDDWDRYGPDDVVDIGAEMMRVTLGIAGQVLFSTDIRDESSGVGNAIGLLLHEAQERVINPLRAPLSVPTRKNLQVRRSLASLEKIVQGLIAEHRARPDAYDDLLTMLLQAVDEDTGETMTDVQVRDEVMTFILAGHETTSNALSWAWHSLSLNPAVRRKLQAEVDATFDSSPSLEDLAGLRYTEMVFDETTRLYPPAWVVERTPIEDDELGGYPIPAGCVIMAAPYFVHRNPRVWDNPLGFDPERFSEEARKGRHRFAHFPFGGGPRKCVGADFAVTEAKIILSMITKRYELDLVPGHRIVPEATITLRPTWGEPPRPGLPMHLRRRA